MRRCLAAAAMGVVWCLTGAAGAHIDLTTPTPREQGALARLSPNSNLKHGPCGQLADGRTNKVNVFAPGQTIEVTWAEITNHRSYYRVAFDRDGDDAFPTFEGPGTGAQGIDPTGPCPVDGQVILAYDMDDRNGGSHTLSVRLPDVECENCTLQVVQFMFDTLNPYYFQCADLALRRPEKDPRDAGPQPPDASADAAVLDGSAREEEAHAAEGCWSRIAPLPAPSAARDETADADTKPVSAAPPPPAAAPAPSPAATLASPAHASNSGCALGTASASRPSPGTLAMLVVCSALLSSARRASRRARAS